MVFSDLTPHYVVIYKTFCLDVTQGRWDGAPNGTQTDSCLFACLACKTFHHPKHPKHCTKIIVRKTGIFNSFVYSDYWANYNFKNEFIFFS